MKHGKNHVPSLWEGVIGYRLQVPLYPNFLTLFVIFSYTLGFVKKNKTISQVMDVNCNDIGRLLVRLIKNELLKINFEEKTIDIEQT